MQALGSNRGTQSPPSPVRPSGRCCRRAVRHQGDRSRARREPTVTAVYLAAFIVGALGVLTALVFDFGHGDGLPFLGLTGLAAALLGGGTGGLIGTWFGLGGVVSGLVALSCGAALVGVQHGVLLPYLR